MKKIILLLVSTVMILSLAACSGNASNNNGGQTTEIGGYEQKIPKDVQTLITNLTNEGESLISSIKSYDDYVNRAADVEAFYKKILEDNDAFWLGLYKDTLAWTNKIISSDDGGGSVNQENQKDPVDRMDVVDDVAYEDGPNAIYRAIYEDVYEDIYEALYDGVLEDQPSGVDYGEWLDVRFTEYDNWLNSRSDMHKKWLKNRTELSKFIVNVRYALSDEDTAKLEEELAKFQEIIEKMQ